MKVEKYVDRINWIDLLELQNKTLEDLILIFHAKHLQRLYIVKNKKPIGVISPQNIIDIFLDKKQMLNAFEFFRNNNYMKCFNVNDNIVDAYYKMRKENIDFIPVCNNNEIIGELNFETLSLKISYIVIKDELTHVYNRKYFEVIIQEYNDFNKPMGIIFIKIDNLPVYEGLYGVEMAEKIIKEFSKTILCSVRKIDFVFRWDNEFRIITFNDLEKSTIIYERLKEKLSKIEINTLHIPFKCCISHVPELLNNILSAVDDCEEKLIERE